MICGETTAQGTGYDRGDSGPTITCWYTGSTSWPVVLASHAAALFGEGSEVLGFDDEVSTDHDFGPRVQLFVPTGLDITPMEVALGRLPARFDGFAVVYPAGSL